MSQNALNVALCRERRPEHHTTTASPLTRPQKGGLHHRGDVGTLQDANSYHHGAGQSNRVYDRCDPAPPAAVNASYPALDNPHRVCGRGARGINYNSSLFAVKKECKSRTFIAVLPKPMQTPACKT